MSESKLDDLVTIEAAARRVKMQRDRVRQLSIASGIAVRWGGTERHPRLKVRVSDLERVILNQRYTVPGRKAKPRPLARVAAAALHPDVKC